jgi:hypothetical protein
MFIARTDRTHAITQDIPELTHEPPEVTHEKPEGIQDGSKQKQDIDHYFVPRFFKISFT